MQRQRNGERGFVLIGVLVAILIMLIFLGVAAPKVSRAMRREKEERAVEEGRQYVRAIRVYYRKFGHYPTSIEQLEKTNNIRFLRQHYVDPMTGKDDWRLIHVGQNKTQVKGFFGQPLAGAPGTSNLGGGGLGNNSMNGTNNTSPNSGGVGGGFTNFGASLFGASGNNSGTSGALGATGGGTANNGTTGSTGSTGMGSGLNSSSGMTGLSMTSGGGPIMGVGLSHSGDSIIAVNDQTTYDTWEFLYDPRSEPRLTGQTGLNSTGANQLGSGGALGSGSSMNGNSNNNNGFGSTNGNSGTNGSSGSGGFNLGPGSNTNNGTRP